MNTSTEQNTPIEELNIFSPSKKNKTYLPALPEDSFEVEITQIIVRPSKWTPEDGNKLHIGFAIVEDGEHYGRHIWKNDINPKISPPSDYPASTLWKICSAIERDKLSVQRSDEIAFSGTKLKEHLLNARLRVIIKCVPDKKDPSILWNRITDYMMAKDVLLPAYNKEKSDAIHEARKAQHGIVTPPDENENVPNHVESAPPEDAWLGF